MTVPVDISQPPVNEPNIDLEGTYVEAEDVPPIQENNLPAAVPQALTEELVQDLMCQLLIGEHIVTRLTIDMVRTS